MKGKDANPGGPEPPPEDDSIWADGAMTVEEFQAFIKLGRTETFKVLDSKQVENRKWGRRRLIARRSAVQFLERLPDANKGKPLAG